MIHMRKTGFQFAIDVSGTPYKMVTIGLVSFNANTVNSIVKEFNKKFPEYSKSKRKGSKIKANDLEKIIRFLDEEKVRMATIKFQNED